MFFFFKKFSNVHISLIIHVIYLNVLCNSQIAIKGPRCDITLYVHDYGPGYIYAKVSGPTFEDGLYNVTVVGINRLDVESDPVNTQVTVLTVPPKVKAGNRDETYPTGQTR